ncbi:MAG: GNAT family N-acetyltransferase [Bacteroidia bacterium]
MRFEPITEADLPFIPELQPPEWTDILPQIKFYLSSPYCHPIKVAIDNKMVGIGATIIHHKTAWLAHIIVHPDYRNKGIGKLITQNLINSLNTTDCKTILLIATALGEPVYNALGFQVETEYIFFKGEKISSEKADSENIKPLNSAYTEALFRLDKEVSGEDRRWRLQENLEGAYMYIDENTFQGFYMPALGEGLIIARTEIAGKSLMEFRLKRMDNAVFPAENLSACEVMLKNGFKQHRTAKRMRLGDKIPFNPLFLFNRVAGSIG